jgi:hypothetical protein
MLPADANYLCSNSTYANSGDWRTMHGLGVPHGNVEPNQSHAFWTQRFTEAKEHFGMGAFWNDHMHENMAQYTETSTVPGAMRTWMKGQADAALATGTPVMWCMELGSEMVQAVEFPAVTTGRASGDYHPPSSNWNIGPESLLLSALGKSASKDGINTGNDCGSPGCGRETRPVLHTLTAVLSRGPVSVGDRPGATNFAILRPCCSAASDILSPSSALVPIDATYQADSVVKGLAIWTTHCNVSGTVSYTVLAAQLPQAGYHLLLRELWPVPAPSSKLWAYTWNSTQCKDGLPASACLREMTDSQPLRLVPISDVEDRSHAEVAGRGAWDQVRYEIVVPQLPHGWILLGETRAYVPLSPVRFVSVAVSASGARGALELLVRGKPAEVVTVVAQKPQAKVLSSVRVTITSAGTAKVSIPA